MVIATCRIYVHVTQIPYTYIYEVDLWLRWLGVEYVLISLGSVGVNGMCVIVSLEAKKVVLV